MLRRGSAAARDAAQAAAAATEAEAAKLRQQLAAVEVQAAGLQQQLAASVGGGQGAADAQRWPQRRLPPRTLLHSCASNSG